MQKQREYTLSIPFMLKQIDRYGAEQFIEKLKELGADIVFLSLDSYEPDEVKREKVFSALKENVPLFQKAGFTVGVWVWAFMVRGDQKYVHITSPNGAVSHDQVCPSDEEFLKFAYEYMQNIAKSNPDIILFDDDYRYGFLDCGLGCTCKNHRAYISKLLGEDVSTKELGKLIFGGGRNKYRSAFLQANGHYFKEFARRSRAAVDSVNPKIRLGLCSCMTTWDFDGVSAAELARIMAGNTKPFLRLIGAAYWSYNRGWGNRLQDVIELERMESSWCGDGIEILAEGDAYPRPRFTCSANVLEGFDMALRASGATNGIHKYPLDYHAEVGYEEGYNRKHLENQGIYQAIEESFNDKTPVGVRVYEHMNKFEDMDVPAYWEGSDQVQNAFFSPAARTLAAQSIPSVYQGLGTVGIAFGENAKYLEDGALENGLILDVTAAQILEKKGVDVGLSSVGEEVFANEEYFPKKKRYVGLFGCAVKKISVKDGADVQSLFVDGDTETIGSYAYENANGQKFLVFAFEGYRMTEHAFKQYARGEQIEEWIDSLGKKLPASMHGNPDCYLLCKESERGKAVWIGNFFTDECMNTTVTLDKAYTNVKFINCNGRLEGDKVILDSVPPYASVGFEVTK
ncbi:MAG: hypothetical protein IJF64_01515 [Clostridia bacterium]|nr:hypothetical protein [Clostridia bacterium]